MYAVLITESMMINYPYSNYFPQCFFNPDGRKLILPQIVEKVPTATPIRKFFEQKGIEKKQYFCEKLSKKLKTQQDYMMDRGFVRLGKLSTAGRKRSSSPIPPSFDKVQEGHADWKKKLEERQKSAQSRKSWKKDARMEWRF